MKKQILKDCIYHSKIKEHLKIKDSILLEIENDDVEFLKTTNAYYSDNVSKLDWTKCRDLTRKWVEIFLPHFNSAIQEIFAESPYTCLNLEEAWYQQYLNSNTHGWHDHGGHFTGVYYLEFPPTSAKTELFVPFDNSFIQIDALEGDIIVFPTHIVHRAMMNGNDRKTIISFNLTITGDLNLAFLSDNYNKNQLN